MMSFGGSSARRPVSFAVAASLALLAVAPVAPATARTKPAAAKSAAVPAKRAGKVVPAAAAAGDAPGGFSTTAQHVYMMDYDSGTVLFDKAGEDHIPTASLSKMMTAYVVFDQLKKGKIKLDDKFPVSKEAWQTGGSKMFVPVGGEVSVEDLVKGMVIQSGNDACVVLSEGIAGSQDAFVQMMNDMAKKIGLNDSHFADVNGLPNPDHYMTARDLALLGAHLIRDFPEYYHYFSEMDYTFNGIKQGNRNPLLYKNIGADGIKTGHTEEAGFGLAASVKRGNRRLIMVATGMQSMNGRADEGEKIIDYGFREFQSYQIVKKGDEIDQADVWLGVKPRVPLAAAGDLSVAMPRTSRKDMKVTLNYDGPLTAPVHAGTVVGKLVVTVPNMPDQEIPVAAAEDVAQLGPMGRIGAAVSALIWHNH